MFDENINGLVKDCNISIASSLEILQSFTKSSIYNSVVTIVPVEGIHHQILDICRFNSSRPRQNGRHFADAIFNRVSLNENVWIPTKISLKLVPKGPINNVAALADNGLVPSMRQAIMWTKGGSLPTHICVTRPQCIFIYIYIYIYKHIYIQNWHFKANYETIIYIYHNNINNSQKEPRTLFSRVSYETIIVTWYELVRVLPFLGWVSS